MRDSCPSVLPSYYDVDNDDDNYYNDNNDSESSFRVRINSRFISNCHVPR